MSSMKPSKFDLVEDLRNFSVHYAIPPATLPTMWHGCGGQPMRRENVVALDRGELLK